jgi:hypothetical protein
MLGAIVEGIAKPHERPLAGLPPTTPRACSAHSTWMATNPMLLFGCMFGSLRGFFEVVTRPLMTRPARTPKPPRLPLRNQWRCQPSHRLAGRGFFSLPKSPQPPGGNVRHPRSRPEIWSELDTICSAAERTRSGFVTISTSQGRPAWAAAPSPSLRVISRVPRK